MFEALTLRGANDTSICNPFTTHDGAHRIGSPVKEVYGVAPVVFNVPTKARKTHSNVDPRHFHS